MTTCEKCWGDAYRREMANTSKDQAQHYSDLLEERKDNPCTPEQQAGQWWDENHQCDTRKTPDHDTSLMQG